MRGQISHNVEMSHSELEQALRAHGLTSIAEHGVFGYDAPPLLEAAPRLDHEPDEPIER